MPEPTLVDLEFRGLSLGSLAAGTQVSLHDNGGSFFIEHEAPLPVGSKLTVGKREAQVTAVVELEVGGKQKPGMRISWMSAPAAVVVAPVAQDTVPGVPPDMAADLQAESAPETPEPEQTGQGDAGGAKKGKKKGRRATR